MSEQVGTSYPEPVCSYEDITPEIADKWLALNHINRHLSEPEVARLAGIIQRGEWMPDSTDAIGLDADGGVVNGQHRLTGVVRTGITIRALVVRNVRPEVIRVIDTGRGRSFTQLLQMQGTVPNATVVAPAIEWLYKVNNGFEQTGPRAFAATIPQLLDLFNKNPHIVESVAPATDVFKVSNLPPKPHLCAYHYMMASVDSGMADDFFNALATGVDLAERAPVRILRERLLKENAKDKVNQKKGWEIDAWLVKAWEFTRQGVEINDKQLVWTATGRGREPYPKVTDLPWADDVVDSAVEPDDDGDGDSDD